MPAPVTCRNYLSIGRDELSVRVILFIEVEQGGGRMPPNFEDLKKISTYAAKGRVKDWDMQLVWMRAMAVFYWRPRC